MQRTQQTKLNWSQLALLNPRAEQRLKRRIIDAEGNIHIVIQDLSDQLNRLDQQPLSGDVGIRTQQQADRAFYVAQLSYLTALLQAGKQPKQAEPHGVVERLRAAVGRA